MSRVPAILVLKDGTVFRGTSIGAEGLAVGRGGVQHRHDRLPGNPHRSVVLPADRHADLSAHRQHGRQRRRTWSRTGFTPPGSSSATCRCSPRTGASSWTLSDYLKQQGVPGDRRHRYAQADAHPARQGRAGRLPDGGQGGRGRSARGRARVSRAGRHGSREGRELRAAVRVERERVERWARAMRRSRRHDSTSSPTTSASSATSCASSSSRGCRVTVVPAQTPAEEVLALKPDGMFLSNGPGDPEPCDYAITRDPQVARRRRSRSSASASATSCWGSRAARRRSR